MLVCKQCGTKQLEGTLFCTECGASLEVSSPGTTASLARQSETAQSEHRFPMPESSTAQPGDIIALVIVATGKRIQVDTSKEQIIGRKDNRTGATPTIDLSEEGGYEGGVSRQHAILSVQNGVCLIEDLESSNGTFVNGRLLEAYQPTPLHHRDNLTLGKLLLRVDFRE